MLCGALRCVGGYVGYVPHASQRVERRTRTPRQPFSKTRVAMRGRGGRLDVQSKMFIPGEYMNGESAEAKGARHLNRVFTYVAVRIIQGQLEGIGNDGGFAPQATGMKGKTEAPDLFDLFDCLEEVPFVDGDAWIGELLKRNPPLAIRVMDVRKAYLEDFNWEKLRDLTQEGVSSGADRLLQQHLESMGSLPEEPERG